MKIAGHFFANGNRCMLKIRETRAKYVDQKKYPTCFEEQPRVEGYFTQLRCVTSVSPQAEAESAGFAASSTSLQPIRAAPDAANSDSDYANLLYNRLNAAVRDDLPAPLECEIYTNLCAKRGRLLFWIIRPGKGFLIFVGATKRALEVDHRTTYEYSPSVGAYTIKKWRLKDLRTACRKWVVEAKTAVELEFYTGKSVMLNFLKEQDAEVVCKKLVKLKESYCTGLKYEGSFDGPKILEKSRLTEAWAGHKCSTFDYLLALNNYSSRSFNNLSQYPVFPWLLADYKSPTLSLGASETFRDLSKNMGMAGDKARAEEFKEKFNRPDLTGQGHFNFGSHYSSPGIVFQYLMRTHPIFEAYVKFFAGLDIPNRMFHSFAESWTCAFHDSTDVRELIPEFFSFPQVFLNRERIIFGEREDDKQRVDHILLPPWAKSSPFTFVTEMRRALESEYVGQQLGRWIDLIFGWQQRGKEAEKAWNVFPPLCYEPAKVLQQLGDSERADYRLQAFDWGQTPQQLFTKRHVDRRAEERRYYAVCDSGAKLGLYCSREGAEEDLVRKEGARPASRKNAAPVDNSAIYIKAFGGSTINSRFILVTFSGTIIEGSIAELAEHDPLLSTQSHPTSAMGMITSGIVETTTKKYKSPYVTDSKWKILDPDLTHNFPLVILHNHNPPYIVQAGCLDGSVQLTSLSKGDKTIYRKLANSPITCLVTDQEERVVLAGTRNGDCLAFESGDGLGLVQTDHLRDHREAIQYIHASSSMSLFLTSSLDGTANLYTLAEKPQILRTFYNPAGKAFNYVSLRERTGRDYCQKVRCRRR